MEQSIRRVYSLRASRAMALADAAGPMCDAAPYLALTRLSVCQLESPARCPGVIGALPSRWAVHFLITRVLSCTCLYTFHMGHSLVVPFSSFCASFFHRSPSPFRSLAPEHPPPRSTFANNFSRFVASHLGVRLSFSSKTAPRRTSKGSGKPSKWFRDEGEVVCGVRWSE